MNIRVLLKYHYYNDGKYIFCFSEREEDIKHFSRYLEIISKQENYVSSSSLFLELLTLN